AFGRRSETSRDKARVVRVAVGAYEGDDECDAGRYRTRVLAGARRVRELSGLCREARGRGRAVPDIGARPRSASRGGAVGWRNPRGAVRRGGARSIDAGPKPPWGGVGGEGRGPLRPVGRGERGRGACGEKAPRRTPG